MIVVACMIVVAIVLVKGLRDLENGNIPPSNARAGEGDSDRAEYYHYSVHYDILLPCSESEEGISEGSLVNIMLIEKHSLFIVCPPNQ